MGKHPFPVPVTPCYTVVLLHGGLLSFTSACIYYIYIQYIYSETERNERERIKMDIIGKPRKKT